MTDTGRRMICGVGYGGRLIASGLVAVAADYAGCEVIDDPGSRFDPESRTRERWRSVLPSLTCLVVPSDDGWGPGEVDRWTAARMHQCEAAGVPVLIGSQDGFAFTLAELATVGRLQRGHSPSGLSRVTARCVPGRTVGVYTFPPGPMATDAELRQAAERLPGDILERIDLGRQCWEWTGPLTPTGYGIERRRAVVAAIDDGNHRPRGVPAHRLVWELLVGPIPTGYVLDHVCGNHACVRPFAHLEPVTNGENTGRGPGPRFHLRPDAGDLARRRWMEVEDEQGTARLGVMVH